MAVNDSKMSRRYPVEPGDQVHVDAVVDWLDTMLPEPRLVMLVGIPASGKSTLSERLTGSGFYYLSLDSIRKELFGDESVQTGFKQVISLFHRRLRRALSRRRDIIIDATSVRYADRCNVLRPARKKGYRNITLVLMDTPLQECLRRNQARERVVPHEVIVSLHKELKGRSWPRRREGLLVVLRPGDDREHYRVHRIRPPR